MGSARGCFARRRGRAEPPPGGRTPPPRRCWFRSISLQNAPAFTVMECLGVLGPLEGTALRAAMPTRTARSRVVAALHRGRAPGSGNATTLGAALAPPPWGCAWGGFSERKSLLFCSKSALGPLQGQGLVQQNMPQWDKGGANSHDGVGEEKADGSGASVFACREPGSCSPSEWGSLPWRESSHPKPARALFSPRVAAILCLPLPPPLLSCCPPTAAPAMAACLLLPGNTLTGRKTLRKMPRKMPQHSHPPHHTPSLLLPQLLPCCLPATSRRLRWPGPPSLPTSLTHGRVGEMLNFGELVPAGWLKHVPHGGFLTSKPRGCCGHQERALMAGAGP